MLLKDWMRSEGLSDDDVAERIGDYSGFMVRAIRFQVKGPSLRVAARIEAITGGKVRATDLLPAPPRRSVSKREAVL